MIIIPSRSKIKFYQEVCVLSDQSLEFRAPCQCRSKKPATKCHFFFLNQCENHFILFLVPLCLFKNFYSFVIYLFKI